MRITLKIFFIRRLDMVDFVCFYSCVFFWEIRSSPGGGDSTLEGTMEKPLERGKNEGERKAVHGLGIVASLWENIPYPEFGLLERQIQFGLGSE